MLNNVELPPYTLRKSKKARYLQLKITAHGQLELIVPQRISQAKALLYLWENRAWIDARRDLIQAQQRSELEFPQEICLHAINCHWFLNYEYGAIRSRVKESFNDLKIYLQSPEIESAVKVLKRWLKQKAQWELTPWLQRLSRDCQLPYKNLVFRGQKTLWGSCTRDNDISLNYKLLFLPAEYVEYVLIHELCHTIYFDHSARFWQLVEKFLPNWRNLRREVKKGDKWLPNWLKN